MMRQRQKPGASRTDEQAVRDQEVLRATRELAAYFRGKRTEREARAALKIIKAFVRDREQLDSKNRPPLPLAGNDGATVRPPDFMRSSLARAWRRIASAIPAAAARPDAVRQIRNAAPTRSATAIHVPRLRQLSISRSIASAT